MQTYTVQSGDTLYGISKQFGVSVDELKRINNLTSNTITKGEILKIPSTVTTIDYVVKKIIVEHVSIPYKLSKRKS